MAKSEEYYKAVALLAQDVSPADVAEQLRLSQSTVIRWNSEYRKAKEDGSLNKLLDLDELTIHTAATILDVPVMAEAKALAKVNSAQMLEQTVQTTATNLVTRINSMAAGASGSDELCMLVDALCKLQSAFFNKAITQVNVQNNLNGVPGGQGAYSRFLKDAPGE